MASPLLYRAAPLHGEWYRPLTPRTDAAAFTEARYTPNYPSRSPLEDVLRRVAPGSDAYVTEGYAYEIGAVLARWSTSMLQGRFSDLRRNFDAAMQAASLLPVQEAAVRPGAPIQTYRRQFDPAFTQTAGSLAAQLESWWSGGLRVVTAEFEITALEVLQTAPLAVRTAVRFDMVAVAADDRREQRTGYWQMEWSRKTPAATWALRRWQVAAEERSVLHGAAFVDVTEAALSSVPSYRQQLLRGSDEWRTQLDGASGIDVYGNNGVAAGDFDGDGLDDLYISQPAGLPNRLYRNRGDGTFEDVTERAGVGVLDNTACALFADFRNRGLQDLLVVCGTGPLLFENQGDGTFLKKPDAFRFATPPAGTFTSAAVADYDRDGRLDVYFCVYSYYLGLDQYHYPAPYFDARNGPPNFLFHNEGDGIFTDRTAAAGLNAENDRYSFACAWGESTETGLPDLYEVNDFGRNNLYRNQGDGTFQAVSTAAHVEDVGAGMSAAWADMDNDGRADLYVANMWSAAGQRVAQQAIFHADSTPAVREQYQRHARGNALYRNDGQGGFQNVSRVAGAEVGRWAWASDFLDFDHNGLQDVYVTNGYITAPVQAPTRNTADDAERVDLSSFFWRQVVAKSSDDATPSQAYEHGWNALNELIRTDHSWSGSERNVLLRNNGDGTFSDVAGLLGLDCIEDSRSLALADLDGDGRLEIILKNRSAPQVRILHNAMEGIGDSIVLRLRGARTDRNNQGSNRDAIGAAVTLTMGELRQTRWVQAGSGFLGQHSRELLFGLGKGDAPVKATVRWPSGAVQQFDDLQRNRRIELTEGSRETKTTAFRATPAAYAARKPVEAVTALPTPSPVQTWLLDPLKAPGFSLLALDGSTQTLEAVQGRVTLLHFWSVDAPACAAQLQQWPQPLGTLTANNIILLTIDVDRGENLAKARAYAAAQRFTFPVLLGGEDVPGIYSLIYRYLYDRRRDLPLPCTFLLDANGMIVKVYGGPVDPQQVMTDARAIPATPEQRMVKALPFPGVQHQAQFTRNDFTYGVAMFQHGYLDQAAESFAQVVASRPDNAEAYYNLGTLNLRRNRPDEARQYLQKTLELKPNYPEAWNNLGMLAGQRGQMAEAVQSFQQALAQRPSYATALLNLGNAYRRQRDFRKAADALQQALALQPDDPEASYSMGMLYAQQNQPAPAAEYLNRAIALRPDYPEARNNLGVLLVRTKDYAGAEAQFTTCIQQMPDFDESYINLARLYLLQGNKAKAREALQSLLQRKPGNTAAKQGLAALEAAP